MTVIFILIWLFALWIAYHAIFVFVGLDRMVRAFPEGDRWWLKFAQLASLAFFALVVLSHPWSNWFRSLV